MTGGETCQCSQCGKQEDKHIRYLACVSTSECEVNNFPAVNTLFTTKNDFKIWKIALCNSYMPLSYKIFLQNRIKSSLRWLGFSFFMLALSLLINYMITSEKLVFFRTAMNIAGFTAFVIGIIWVPAKFIILIINLIKLRNLNKKGDIDQKNKDKSFIGEGERIINEMEQSSSTWLESHFPLPKYKEFNDLLITDERKKKIINKKFGKRKIIAVAQTPQELENVLMEEWLELLKTTSS